MFDARVIRVLIASPGDTAQARAVIREAVEDWNGLNAEDGQRILLSVHWERDATPELGAPPQRILNRQIVDTCDIVVASFWTKLGTPTVDGKSGTVEEIERSAEAGKPVLVYFSNEPVVPESIDADEYRRLDEFRSSLKSRGLYGEFSTPEELRRKVGADLTRIVREHFGGGDIVDPGEATAGGADLLAAVTSDREVRSYSSRGQPNFSTRYRLSIQNRGSAAAEDLTFVFEGAHPEGSTPPEAMEADVPVKLLPPGGVIEYYLIVVMGSALQFEIVMEWREGDGTMSQTQTLRI